MKVNTGADASFITTTDLKHFPFPITILPCSNTLIGYGGSKIGNINAAILNIFFKDESIKAKFNIVEASGTPSMLGCGQCQELGIIAANVDEDNASLTPWTQPEHTPKTESDT